MPTTHNCLSTPDSGSARVFWARLHSLDCSDLAAAYAAQATNDPKLMAMVIDERQQISPNDLARYFGS